MPKVVRDKKAGHMRHDPLAEQITQDQATKNLRVVPREKLGRSEKKGNLEDEVLASVE